MADMHDEALQVRQDTRALSQDELRSSPHERGGVAVPNPRRSLPGVRAQLVPTRGASRGAGIPLVGDRITIGRDAGCDLVLDDATVSRHHAEVHREDAEHYVVLDVGSLNGIYLNRGLVQHAALTDGDELWIGKARFAFRLSSGPEIGEAEDPLSAPEMPVGQPRSL